MTAGRAPAVRLVGVERRFGARPALGPISGELPAGAGLALLGPNGAGKSTLLRLLAQLLRPSSGRIELWGLDPAEEGAALRARIGYLGHRPQLYELLTPEENLVLAARAFALPRPAEAAAEALAAVGLSRRADERVGNLSRGMQQRVALARALLHRPDLLLLDEPATALDREGREILRERLAAHRREGGAFLLATHDGREAARICDLEWRIERGRRVG